MGSKQCSGCLKRKPTTEFGRHQQTKSGLRSRCKECNRKEARGFYKRNSAAYKKRAYAYKQEVRAELLLFMDHVRKTLGCQTCTEREVCCLDFHHMKKGIPLGRAANNSYNQFLRELRKCVVLCANCHRKAHAGLLRLNTSMCCKAKRAADGVYLIN